jgi:CopA family copper-resistance protein
MPRNKPNPPRRETALISRRRMVQGVAVAGMLDATHTPLRATPVPTRSPILSGPILSGPILSGPILSGTDFALEIGSARVNITGRSAPATVVNGLLPGPILRWREGDTVTLAVTNTLDTPTSIHWHGIRLPSNMDGVPGMSFPGIAPGETFIYRFPVRQSGTYWYHSHSGFQEQTGLYGAIVVDPKAGYAQKFDRDYVVLLSDWSDEAPETILSNLKFQSDYYNFQRRTAGTFIQDVGRKGFAATVADRLEWGRMRMAPTDILDVAGATYTYLVNGQPPGGNWTALFRAGERVRLRFINGSAMSIFDVRIPGLSLTVVQADGNDVEPVEVDEFRIGTAETYDVIVRPMADQAFTIFAQTQDRSGFARGTLSPRLGLAGPVPPMDPTPMRTMADMGMAGMDHGRVDSNPGQSSMGAPPMDHRSMPGMTMPGMTKPSKTKLGTTMGEKGESKAEDTASGTPPAGVGVDNVAEMPQSRIGEPGSGLEGNGRRVLVYGDLRALRPGTDPRPPSREIVLHLTGNMERFMWGFDGKKFSQAEPIQFQRNERVRFVLLNDTMMEHPIHLHGLWSELENDHGAYRPYKHTVLVKPGERLSYLVTADEPGRWAYHCHLLYHMETGMFREVHVA